MEVQVTSENWRYKAACVDVDPDLFFPAGESSRSDKEQIDRAKKICHACAAVAFCLEYALTNNEDAGIWGEMTENERRALKRRGARNRRANYE